MMEDSKAESRAYFGGVRSCLSREVFASYSEGKVEETI